MKAFNRVSTLALAFVICVTSSSFAATLSTKVKDGIGGYLADDSGKALYIFKKDSENKSVCGATNGCIEKWPVFFADSVAQNVGINESDVGVITRDDGVKQTTFKGQPLYYFFKDKAADDILGQGLNNVWYVVAP
ncbi:MAG: hypothetical protein ACOYL3_07285 [Desulfuromonadaceae bacterium]